MGRPIRLQWKESGDDKDEVVKADGEVGLQEGSFFCLIDISTVHSYGALMYS
jgi:hypothetical protein